MTKIKTYRLEPAYIDALKEMAQERGAKSETQMLKYCIIETYLRTHSSESWDRLLNKIFDTHEPSKSDQDVS